MLLSTSLLLEYEAICKDEKHLAVSGLTADDVNVVLNVLVARCEKVETNYRWRPQLRDAGDEMVLEAAVNGRADALVTFNERDFAFAAPRFALELMGPAELLRRMR